MRLELIWLTPFVWKEFFAFSREFQRNGLDIKKKLVGK